MMKLQHCSSLCIFTAGKTQNFLNRILGCLTEMRVVMAITVVSASCNYAHSVLFFFFFFIINPGTGIAWMVQ